MIDLLEIQHKEIKGMSSREVLRAIAHDWFNDYLSYEAYADHNGLTVDQAKKLIALARDVERSNHLDM